MEEEYKGYTVRYDEEESIFKATDGKHNFVHGQLKEMRRKIDRQAAHDKGFKPFEAWYLDGRSLRRVRVTSVKQEPVRRYGEGFEYYVRITYLDKSEDDSWQRNEVPHTGILALDPASEKRAKELNDLVEKRNTIDRAIKGLAEGIPRITPGDLGITEEAK